MTLKRKKKRNRFISTVLSVSEPTGGNGPLSRRPCHGKVISRDVVGSCMSPTLQSSKFHGPYRISKFGTQVGMFGENICSPANFMFGGIIPQSHNLMQLDALLGDYPRVSEGRRAWHAA
jgi:hypothetical protein